MKVLIVFTLNLLLVPNIIDAHMGVLEALIKNKSHPALNNAHTQKKNEKNGQKFGKKCQFLWIWFKSRQSMKILIVPMILSRGWTFDNYRLQMGMV